MVETYVREMLKDPVILEYQKVHIRHTHWHSAGTCYLQRGNKIQPSKNQSHYRPKTTCKSKENQNIFRPHRILQKNYQELF